MEEREKDGSRRATLAVIAKAAGVSLPTVSKVLNGRADVAEVTRARVQRLLVEHDYVASAKRRGQMAGRVIDLAFNSLTSPYALEIIRGVTEAAAEEEVDVVVGQTPDDTLGARWARKLAGSGREGIICVTSKLTAQQRRQFADMGIPLLVIDPVNLPTDDVPSVGATNWAGGLAATEHLIQLGHRRIAAIGGREDALCSRARLHGYRAALDAAGVPADPALVRHGNFQHEPAYRHALDLLDLEDQPTAVFAGSDLQAFAVIEAARVRGLRVPQDLSVVGFDDLPVARWVAPPLTTVRQPLTDMGRMAVRVLLRLAAGETLESHRVELATQLIVRESTAPPPPHITTAT